jgi:hypothetical protein
MLDNCSNDSPKIKFPGNSKNVPKRLLYLDMKAKLRTLNTCKMNLSACLVAIFINNVEKMCSAGKGKPGFDDPSIALLLLCCLMLSRTTNPT